MEAAGTAGRLSQKVYPLWDSIQAVELNVHVIPDGKNSLSLFTFTLAFCSFKKTLTFALTITFDHVPKTPEYSTPLHFPFIRTIPLKSYMIFLMHNHYYLKRDIMLIIFIVAHLNFDYLYM